MLEGYLIQLEEADTELEMTGAPKEVIERRYSADDTNDLEVALKEMRTRPRRQKFGGECLEEIIFLAQAVFRQGRLIKNMMVM